jgi:hypothetical protein
MDSMIAKLRVALQLDSAAFESGTTRAANQVNALGINMATAQAKMASFSEGLILSSGAAQRAGQSMRAVNDNAGAMRAGLQSAGFQLQDMAVQFASGQRAGVIFAQQLPQLSGALSQMAAAAGTTSGVVGRLAGFMAGPWGVAVGIGVAVLSPLVAKLFETGEAAEDATAKVSDLKNALAGIKANPMQTLGAINLEIVQAQAKLRQAEAMPRFTGGGSDAYKAGTFVERQRAKAIADAQLALQEAQTTYNVANQVYKNTQQLAAQADKVVVAPRTSGGGSARSTGRLAGRGTASAAEDELNKLQQTTNDILASFKPFGDRTSAQFSGRADKGTEALRAKLAEATDSMRDFSSEATDANRAVGDSFQQMANESLNSLRQLTSGIQSGDFIGILGGVVNLLSSLGGMGVFGKGMQASVAAFNKVPAFAGGTSFAPGGLALVGERGPELVNLPRGSQVYPTGTGPGGGSMQVQVVPSPYFDVRVLQNVGSVAPIIANAGADLGNSRMAKAGRRRLA